MAYLNRKSGLTLVETLLTVFIITVIFVALAVAQRSGIISATSVIDRSELTSKARNTIENISKELASANISTTNVVHCQPGECLGDKLYYKIPVTDGESSIYDENDVIKYGADDKTYCTYELMVTTDNRLVRNTICAEVESDCDWNGVCEGIETLASCPHDCHVCGDGQCTIDYEAPYSTIYGCCLDCGFCGDNVCCSENETYQTCPADCMQDDSGDWDGTCFLAGTMITMADGKQKPIEEIKVGDIVLAFDEEGQEIKPDKVTQLMIHPKVNKYLVVNGHLKITPNHPVLSKGKWIHIGKLNIGDTLTNMKGKDVKITSIEIVNEDVTVYNMEVNPYHTYIANGYMVHNLAKEFQIN